DDLVLPIFLHSKEGESVPMDGMETLTKLSVTSAIKLVKEAASAGINAVALFPSDCSKSENAEEAYNPNNLLCNSIKSIKDAVPNMGIIADVALDPYTVSGHDGIILNGKVDNDATIDILCKQAAVLSAAGCDIVAPSDMMDGRVGAIRKFLDGCSFEEVCILSYAAKFCSSFYKPFRHIVGSCSTSQHVDKSTYQLDFGNKAEAMLEARMDISEGADIVMVKPGMPYLDIIKSMSDTLEVPVFAYQVSGEYAMIKAASHQGWLDYNQAIYESLLCFKRAGANSILTY
ncbi:unnamed protein product, partial [Ixodes pacificus]